MNSFLNVEGPLGHDALGKGTMLYAFGHVWQPEPGHYKSVSGQFYATREEADAAKRRALVEMHYQPPRWWQWWRWGEQQP